MIQHRHIFPGYVGPDSSNTKWWHDENMVHTKKMYAHAHDVILETRVKGDTGSKRSTPAKQVIPRDPEAVRAQYQLERID